MTSTINASSKATVLVLGSTGQVGSLIVDKILESDRVNLRVTSRRQSEVDRLRGIGQDAVFLDLDEPRSFGPALHGIDRVFLLNGYSVAMLTQSKTLIDAAKKSGVQHIVHLGTYGQWDTTDAHFAWHQMVERYIEASGMFWTHLHPNMFMENLLTFFAPRRGAMTVYWGNERMGWVALSDVAAVAAIVLSEGPVKHHKNDYWLSTEVLTVSDLATMLSKETGHVVRPEPKLPDDFQAVLEAGNLPMEHWYAAGAVDFVRQVHDGRMGYIGTVRDDFPYLTGQPSTSMVSWIQANKEKLISTIKA